MNNNDRIFTVRYSILVFISILAFSLQVSAVQAAGRLLVWPVEEDMTQMKARQSLHPYEIRKGQIAINREILPPDKKSNRHTRVVPSQGDEISFNLFADVQYDVKVDSVKRHANETVVVHGKLKNHTMRTVIMTIGSDGYLITLQDMKKGLLYRARGNSQDGSGSVTEIDMKKMPPVIR
ncbi:MAG: hypothetical protein WBN66_00920 [Smithella sp.]